ncbi:MAG: hypothetical protein FJY37_19080, partial [Betaproteobacteria bacterium]|nr:hypothetical protein [Betaproteobacteria bacterium]
QRPCKTIGAVNQYILSCQQLGNSSRALLSASTRRRALYVVREAARIDPEATRDLLAVDANLASIAFEALPVRLAAAATFLQLQAGHVIDSKGITAILARVRAALGEGLERYTALIPTYSGITGICFVGRCTDLERLVSPNPVDALVDDPSHVGHAVDSAIRFLGAIWPDGADAICAHIDVCAGTAGIRGEIRSFSNPHMPGLIVLAINNPLCFLTEQLVHEATHVQLGLLLETDDLLAELLSAMPGCFSPFTDSVRTAERVFHGVLSYGRVLSLWRRFHAHETFDPSWLDCASADAAQAIIEKRITELEARVGTGWRSLIAAASDDEVHMLTDVFERLLEYSPDVHLETKERASIGALLRPIPRAEFILATHGRKVSRISLGMVDATIQREMVTAALPCCYSNYAYLPDHDQHLRRFSNTFRSSCKLIDAGPEHEVLCYVGKDRAVVREAFDLDLDDAAGSFFGIPLCCSQFYERTWSHVRGSGGDLFSELLKKSATSSQINVSWPCNAAAMYAGGGLCWHFPCSVDCQATQELVNQRFVDLVNLDCSLAERLMALQKSAFFWSPSGGYGFPSEGRAEAARLIDVTWTGVPPAATVERAIDLLAHGWHLVTPH